MGAHGASSTRNGGLRPGQVSNACGVYSLTARRFTRDATAATGTTAATYTPIEIKSSTLVRRPAVPHDDTAIMASH